MNTHWQFNRKSTADEVVAVASLFDRTQTAVHLREEVTERAVRSAPLNQYRVVHFATHGRTVVESSFLGHGRNRHCWQKTIL